MAEGSRYEWFRRRLAPVAFLIALGVLVHQTCQSRDRAEVTVGLDYGAAAAQVSHVRADVMVGDESVSWFESGPPVPGVPAQFRALIEGGQATVRIEVTTAAGVRTIERKIVAEGGSAVTLHLGDDLAAPPR